MNTIVIGECMTKIEKLKSGFWAEDRGGDLVLTFEGKQHFCKHENWSIKSYDKNGKPNIMECNNCYKKNYL